MRHGERLLSEMNCGMIEPLRAKRKGRERGVYECERKEGGDEVTTAPRGGTGGAEEESVGRDFLAVGGDEGHIACVGTGGGDTELSICSENNTRAAGRTRIRCKDSQEIRGEKKRRKENEHCP